MNAPPLLHGLRVLELSQLIAAPLCGLQLHDLGADVVKVEPPGGEAGRTMPPFAGTESLWFHALNRGKRGIVVQRGDTETLRRLIARADVVVENLAGALEPLRLEAAAQRPELVWCAITGRGVALGGRAIDPTLQAQMGLAALTGTADGPPLRVPVPVIDLTCAMAATQRVLAARWQVERGGPGGLVDVSLLDAAATLTGLAGVAALAGEPAPRMGSESPLAVPSGVFATRDGHLQVTAFNDRQFRAIATGLGHPEWAEDPVSRTERARLANRAAVHGRVAEVLRTGTTREWADAITVAGGLAEPVRDISEAWDEPLLRERGLLGRLEDPDLPAAMPALSLAVSFAADPAFPAGPRLGEHTDAVLAELG